MHSQLIIDVSDRAFSGLLVSPEGNLLPFSQEIHQVATRYLSSEIVFDPRVTEDPDFIWEDAEETLARANARTFFQRARRLGLYRPWDVQAPMEGLRLPSPLAVLSSSDALLDPVVQGVLPAVGVVLLKALLEPVFAFLDNHNVAPEETEAFIVIPAHSGRHARLALHKVFRRRGFRRPTLICREIAVAMALLDVPAAECQVWDFSEDDLHLYRVAVDGEEGERRFRTLAAQTFRGIGWSHWVHEIAIALGSQGQAPDASGALTPAVDRALTDLLTGSPDSPHRTSRSNRLTRGLIEEVLDSKRCDQWATVLRDRLEPQLSALNSIGSPVILVGAICGLEPLRKLFLSLVAGEQPHTVAEIPVLERTIRGLAAALLWLRNDPVRRVITPPSGGLRLNTFHGDTVEILPATHLPPPGEECYLRQHFSFSGDREAANPFLLQLLWGSDRAPEGNATLCALPLEIGPGDFEERPAWLNLHLRCSVSGRRLSGTVSASFGNEASTARAAYAFFAKDLTTFPSSAEG